MAGVDPDWYHPVTMAGVVGSTVLGAWRLWSSGRSGEIVGRVGDTYSRAAEPLGYWTHYLLTALFTAATAMACAIYIFEALTRGMTADPATWFLNPAPDASYSGYYPQQADNESVNGRVVLRCRVTRTYSLEACVVQSEQPPGYGFGAAALGIGTTRVLPPQDRPKVRVGQYVNFPVIFRMPPGGGTSY